MGVATTAYPPTVSLNTPKTVKRDDDTADTQLGRRERKLMRMTEPSPEEDSVVFDDEDMVNQDPMTLESHGRIDHVTTDAMELVMTFLSPQDRWALMSTQHSFMNESLATSEYSSFCGRCKQCEDSMQHLCKAGDNHRSSSFWRALFVHTGSSGLNVLRLAGCQYLSASTLRAVSAAKLTHALRGLTVLELNRCNGLASEGLRMLANYCENLQEIHLRDMAVDSQALAQLVARNAATLRVVDLLGCHTITGDDVRLLRRCHRLEELNLWGCHNVENAAIADTVIACPTLHSLNLRYCHKVDDALVHVIAGSLPQLRELNVRYCYKVTDAGVDAITQQLVNLEVLNLSQCNKITDVSIVRIVSRLKKLKELRLWGCAKLTTASVEAICEGLPSLALVDIRSQDKVKAVIGGPAALNMLVHPRCDSRVRWEIGEEPGIFKRMPVCAAVAA
ncbi:hypothetical protein PINS_up002126 [Pythium insidiosum]|nr:hypothetical protein PINS_up002126 [Pythium insidiosum]